MIYTVSKEAYPNEDKHYTQQIILKDLDNNTYTLRIIENGFVIKYPLEEKFKYQIEEHTFYFENTGYIFVKNPHFDVFCEIRNIIKTSTQDIVHESFSKFLAYRLKLELQLMNSEVGKFIG